MTSDLQINDTPLPGYRLIDRLGTGGYGEVWKVEAPGGLTKAIKLIFGQQYEKRASRELRALELIKQLRHPFLLSLERIEVVEGRLMIVTELAEGSVKDRFDACRKAKRPGIPRDELLQYLRDAADALDYMAEMHGLQHLDVKPENLLLLAGHVKVSDFGLVKDVRQSQGSLVGGMTPLYAAPEVFRGQPGRQTDQYSLAIVYQEMLTGALPFVGGNAAELTLQHLNDEPDLSSLSGANRYVVSRALSKDPAHRYATCREFVEALVNVATESESCAISGGPTSEASASTWYTKTVSQTNAVTELFHDDSPTNIDDQSQLIELPMPPRPVQDLPPVDVNFEQFRPSPTLLIGIGGAAGRVLRQLRRQTHERYGDSPLPAVQMLLLDTDPQALAEVLHSDGASLLAEETLNLPLRRPQHYRERWNQLLCWLSRRWLYNIPKSLRTEGLRPLGRLALVDHARQSCQRIRRAMLDAFEPEAIAASSATMGCEFRRDALRVYIVCSVSGGTGSGAVLDVAFAVRAMLEKLPLPQTTVMGILLHSTGRDPRFSELARVNAYAWLTEFHHFYQPGCGYNGDVVCGLPSHEAGTSAFDHAYFVHLGDDLDDSEFEQSAGAVAEYLQLDALTSVQVYLDACRQPSAQPTGAASSPNLRSFGVYRSLAVPSGFCERAANVVSILVLNRWRAVGNDRAANSQPSDSARFVRRLQLTAAGLAANARALIDAHLGCGAATFLASWLAEHLPAGADEARQFAAAADVFRDAPDPNDSESKPSILGHSVADIVEPLCDKLRRDVRRWITRRLDDPQQRLAGALASANWLQCHFQAMLKDFQQMRSDLAGKLRELPSAGHSRPLGENQHVFQYFQLRLDFLAIAAAVHVGRLVLSDLKSLADELAELNHVVGHLVTEIQNRTDAALQDDLVAAIRADTNAPTTMDAVAVLRANLDSLVAEVDRRAQTEYVQSQDGLLQTMRQSARLRGLFCAELQEIARQAIKKTLASADATNLGGGWGDAGALKTGLRAAAPTWLRFGGARRVLAIMPGNEANPAAAEALSQDIGASVSIVPGGDNGVTLCVEAERLSILNVALDLVQNRRESAECAQRVHTRTDVRWTPLIAVPPAANSPGSSAVTMAIAVEYAK